MHPDIRRAHETCIRDGLKVHTKIPVAKASGQSSTEHICACFAASTLPEVQDAEHWRQILAEHISITTDQGVEAGLQGFQLASPLQVLPPWVQEAFEYPDVLHLRGGAFDYDMQEHLGPRYPGIGALGLGTVPFLPNALAISGALHILSNLPKDVHQQLRHWPTFAKQLETLQEFLKKRSYRERLQQTCLQGPSCWVSPTPQESGHMFQARETVLKN